MKITRYTVLCDWIWENSMVAQKGHFQAATSGGAPALWQ